MSYAIQSPCFNCDKKDTCTDIQRVQEAVDKIHTAGRGGGHQGCGYITLTCTVQNKPVEAH